MPGAVVVVAGAGAVAVPAGAVIMEEAAGAGVPLETGISMRCVVGACPGPGRTAGCGADPVAGADPKGGADDNGAPTAISHRWPGSPCAGFKGPLAALVVGAGAGAPVVRVLPGVMVVIVAGLAVAGSWVVVPIGSAAMVVALSAGVISSVVVVSVDALSSLQEYTARILMARSKRNDFFIGIDSFLSDFIQR